jgi:hypothetical protein
VQVQHGILSGRLEEQRFYHEGSVYRCRDRRLDLNYSLTGAKRSSVEFTRTIINQDLRVEQGRRVVSPVAAMKKPFDVLAEGLLSKNSRGDEI